jgi:phosphoribosylformylglycinamidine synthase
MFAIVTPENADLVEAICAKWGVPASRIARVVPGTGLRIVHRGSVVAEMPSRSLADDGPVYNRPVRRPDWIDRVRADSAMSLPAPKDLGEALLELLASPNVASKRWVTEQYDWMVQHNTVLGPGTDAAVIRIEGTPRGMAVATDGNARFCFLDPRLGAALAVAEAARNVACAGARPVAITNCLNFGNPEKPEVMWQFGEAVAGITEACRVFGTPVTGGNVSFYNETDGEPIKPTPVIGMLGLIDDVSNVVGSAFVRPGEAVILLGSTKPELDGSEYAAHLHGHVGGTPPELDLERANRLNDLLVTLASRKLVSSAHDCSEGGIAIALAEATTPNRTGARINLGDSVDHTVLFSESPSRVILSCPMPDADAVLALAHDASVPAVLVGETITDRLTIEGAFSLPVADLAEVYENALARAIAAAV